ncbi:uracil-DNA glycosylase [Arthrobacter echini]|uniref:Uracil-DNA glycosylase n=1 Tax=Arthrobacter echini TaxID=1529066 RepID=A0A4V3Z621_9MICC|nr:uracil-DNA glycosylase [Arthrobacter echini]THJ68559.1 uracil-DNA glycosylase [Arthrobacter echini]
MADPAYREQQWNQRYDPQIEDVNRLCDTLAESKPGSSVPYIDPIHDVDGCKIVSLFSNPGPSLPSGFMSFENDDPASIRMAEIYDAAGLRPDAFMPWNAYPWYIPDGKERALTMDQISDGVKPLLSFLQQVPRASALVAHGADAHKAARRLMKLENRAIVKRGFKIYEVRAPGERAFKGTPANQELWLKDIQSAYTDAMGRAGIRASQPI